MKEYILRGERDSVVLPAEAVRRLLRSSNSDAALCYLAVAAKMPELLSIPADRAEKAFAALEAMELEGEEGLNYIEEYSDSSTERGKKLRQSIRDKFHFSSLEFQSLEGIIKAIGLDPSKLCTYCWNGKE